MDRNGLVSLLGSSVEQLTLGNKQGAHDGIISRTKYIFDSGYNTLL